MLAIGNKIKVNNPTARIIYLSSERFVQNMITALRKNIIDKFIVYYRNVDVPLIDDIKFFTKKERSQEKLFYIFNSLIKNQRQIILTCYQFPKKVENLYEQLQSRLAWGLAIAIEPPEMENKVAILIKKAQQNLVLLLKDVALFIAQQIRTKVRYLEAAFQLMMEFFSFTNQPISIDMAQEVLRDLIALHQKSVTLDHIKKTVA